MLQQRALIAELDAQRSLADRVLGLFTFVNIIWMVSITGIVCTVGPCIAFMIGPLLLKVLTNLYESLLRPAGLCLHRWCVFEFCSYLAALSVSVQASRYPESAISTGTMVALTGGLLFIPCWAYSTLLHTTGSGETDGLMTISFALWAAVLSPLALAHLSCLIGFLTVVAGYGALGFVCGSFGFGYYVGFDGESAMKRSITASLLLIVIFAGLHLAGLDPVFLRPFSIGAQVMGTLAYFLALLMLSSGWRISDGSYWGYQAVMAISLLATMSIGLVWSLPAMTNTAIVFLVLYAMAKQLEIKCDGLQAVVAFLNFAALFAASLWLHHHPQFIVSLFDPHGVYL